MKSVIIQLAECNEFGSKFETNDVFWSDIDEIIAVLQSGYDLTINMQKVGYGLSDFYIGWLRVKKNLERFITGEFCTQNLIKKKIYSEKSHEYDLNAFFLGYTFYSSTYCIH